MDEIEHDRPETLPEQFGRVGASFVSSTWRTRARWVPIACLLVYLVLGALQRLLASGNLGVGLGPWWIDAPVRFLGGVIGTAPVIVGLWTGAGAGSAPRRWALGLAAVASVSIAQGADPQFPGSVAGLADPWFWVVMASQVQLWGLWASVGLLVRGLRIGIFRRTKRLDGPAHVGILDLMMLTAAFAIGMGANVWALETLSADESVEVVEFDPVMQVLSLPLGLLSLAIPLTPVLITCFPRGILRLRAIAVGVGFSLAMLFVFRFAVFAILLAATAPPGAIWSMSESLTNCAIDVGTVAGIVSIAFVTRWAGYRLRSLPKRSRTAVPLSVSSATPR